ncbi:MAG: hypothetical protein HUN04_12480 [Desulfobacter sp.]|nr:MAG: hypothetical protein HUN04_12480 [Desulfobacter sp.]
MFESEKQLVDEILFFLQSPLATEVPIDLQSDHQVLLQEVNLGYGIADIVLTHTKDSIVKRDFFLNLIEIKLLKIVNKHPGIRIKDISDRTRLRRKKILSSLKGLSNLNLILTKGDAVYPQEEYVRTVTKTIAIEAKLTNWKRALKQAYRYKWFSHKSFVCLPLNRVNPALKNIESFQRMGVGLIGCCEKNGIQMLYNHESEEPISDEMAILLNEKVLNTMHAS